MDFMIGQLFLAPIASNERLRGNLSGALDEPVQASGGVFRIAFPVSVLLRSQGHPFSLGNDQHREWRPRTIEPNWNDTLGNVKL
jgi:hypothetical protein